MTFLSKTETWILIITIGSHLVSTEVSIENPYSDFKDSGSKTFCVSPLLCLSIKKTVDKTGVIEQAIKSNVEKYVSDPSNAKCSILKTILGLRSVIHTLENLLEKESKRAIRSNQEAIKKELELIKKEKEITKEDTATKNRTVEILLDFEKNNTFLEEDDDDEKIVAKNQIGNPSQNNVDIGASKADYDMTADLKNRASPSSFQKRRTIKETLYAKANSKKSKDLRFELQQAKELVKDLQQIALTPLPMITLHKNVGDGFKRQAIYKRERSSNQNETLNSLKNSTVANGLVKPSTDVNFQKGVMVEKASGVSTVNQRPSDTAFSGEHVQITTLKLSNQTLETKTSNPSPTTENPHDRIIQDNKMTTPFQNKINTQIKRADEVTLATLPKSNKEDNVSKPNKSGFTKSPALHNSSEGRNIIHMKIQSNGSNVLNEVITIPFHTASNPNQNDSRRIQVEISIDPNISSTKSSLVKKSKTEGKRTALLNSQNKQLALKTNQAKTGDVKIKADDAIKAAYGTLKVGHLDRDVPAGSVFTAGSGVESLHTGKVPAILPPDSNTQSKNSLLKKLIGQLEKFTKVIHQNKNNVQQINNEKKGKLKTNSIDKVSRNQRFREDELILHPYPITNIFQEKDPDIKTKPEEEDAKKDALNISILKELLKNSTNNKQQSKREQKDLITEDITPKADVDKSTENVQIETKPIASNKLKIAFHYSKFHGNVPPHLIKER